MIFPIREGGPNLLSVFGPGGPNPRGDRIRGYTGFLYKDNNKVITLIRRAVGEHYRVFFIIKHVYKKRKQKKKLRNISSANNEN